MVEREDCVTCHQECEVLPPCTRVSVLYENICADCNPEATGEKPVKNIKNDPPSIYIGESSRSLQERTQEHHADLRHRREKNHMYKHIKLHHDDQEVPFVMRAVSFHRSALLNSKGKFIHCFIPRLMIMEEDNLEEIRKIEEEDDRKIESWIQENQDSWERDKVKKRAEDMKRDLDGTSRKGQMKAKAPREVGDKYKSKERAPKKIKFSLMEDDWRKKEQNQTYSRMGIKKIREEKKTPGRPWW